MKSLATLHRFAGLCATIRTSRWDDIKRYAETNYVCPRPVYVIRLGYKPAHEKEVTLPLADSTTPWRTRMLVPAFAKAPVMMAANLIDVIDGRIVKPRNVM
jgi:hypothetical protein